MPGCSASSSETHEEDHHHATENRKKVTVYGAHWCGFTQKMVRELKEHGEMLEKHNVEVEHIECTRAENESRCNDITGYPTLKVCGESVSGYRPVPEVVSMLEKCSM